MIFLTLSGLAAADASDIVCRRDMTVAFVPVTSTDAPWPLLFTATGWRSRRGRRSFLMTRKRGAEPSDASALAPIGCISWVGRR
jgi:hypothetical protein